MCFQFEVLRKGVKHIVSVDEIDADLAERHWFILIAKTSHTAYAQRMVYTPYQFDEKLHIVIMERVMGRKLVKGEEVDHIDRNGLNNTRENLRLASRSQNMANRKPNAKNLLGIKGVYKRGNKYRAQIQVNQRKIMLGTFDTPEQAHEAYKQAAIKYFGEFARFE